MCLLETIAQTNSLCWQQDVKSSISIKQRVAYIAMPFASPVVDNMLLCHYSLDFSLMSWIKHEISKSTPCLVSTISYIVCSKDKCKSCGTC